MLADFYIPRLENDMNFKIFGFLILCSVAVLRQLLSTLSPLSEYLN